MTPYKAVNGTMTAVAGVPGQYTMALQHGLVTGRKLRAKLGEHRAVLGGPLPTERALAADAQTAAERSLV